MNGIIQILQEAKEAKRELRTLQAIATLIERFPQKSTRERILKWAMQRTVQDYREPIFIKTGELTK